MTGLNAPKFDIFGTRVSATDYDRTVTWTISKAARNEPGIIGLIAVHGIIEGTLNANHRRQVNRFDIVAPDGQPVRWALNGFHNTNLPDRVYGPELMLRICTAAAAQGISIFLYGSTLDVIRKLERNLVKKFPALKIAGAEAPPFRPLTVIEDREITRRMNQSGAGIVFIGLGCPRQESFAAQHARSINAVQICVGAAFDFHAGNKKMAPAWMQSRGLEWLFRLVQEPRRLWRRYLVTNSIFVLLVLHKILFGRQQAPALPVIQPMKAA